MYFRIKSGRHAGWLSVNQLSASKSIHCSAEYLGLFTSTAKIPNTHRRGIVDAASSNTPSTEDPVAIVAGWPVKTSWPSHETCVRTTTCFRSRLPGQHARTIGKRLPSVKSTDCRVGVRSRPVREFSSRLRHSFSRALQRDTRECKLFLMKIWDLDKLVGGPNRRGHRR